MTDTKTKGETLNLNEAHRSDGSELIPAEVQANTRHDHNQPIDAAASTGYTVDDEGLIDNYAVEPDIYPADYPSPPQQRRYVFLGAGAALLVVILMLLAFAVS